MVSGLGRVRLRVGEDREHGQSLAQSEDDLEQPGHDHKARRNTAHRQRHAASDQEAEEELVAVEEGSGSFVSGSCWTMVMRLTGRML